MRALGPNVFSSPEQIVRRSVTLAHADRADLVSVAGPDSLAAMVSLCRDGFDHVECARQATCSSADEASEVLLIVGRMSRVELADVLRRTCRLLRDGGVLVVQLERPQDDDVVQLVLESKGLRIASTLLDPAVGCLVSHTVERPTTLRKVG
jgi:hypothetical protein